MGGRKFFVKCRCSTFLPSCYYWAYFFRESKCSSSITYEFHFKIHFDFTEVQVPRNMNTTICINRSEKFQFKTQWHIDFKDWRGKFQFMTQWHIDFKDRKGKFQFMTQWHIDFRHKIEKKWLETEVQKNLYCRIFQLMTQWHIDFKDRKGKFQFMT